MTKKSQNTTLCYIEKDGCVLMMHRIKKKNDENKDKWIGIGGHFEPFESPEDCVLREAQEETGLTLTDLRYRGIVTFVCEGWAEAEYMHLFQSTAFTGALKECDEGDLQWIPRQRMYELPMWEGDKIFLDLLATDEPFFSLKLVYEGLDEAVHLSGAWLNGRKIR